MNKIIIAAILPWLFAAVSYKTIAQEAPKATEPTKETQEIIIRKKGEKDASVKIEFKNDKVFINGKPMVEFKDDEIIINNRKIRIRELESDFEGMGREMEEMGKEMDVMGREMELAFGGDNFNWEMAPKMSKTFLGVTTEKKEDAVEILEVVKGSAAENAGLKAGDIITKIDDKKVNNPAELAEIIGSMEPKKIVTVYYKRDGKNKTAKATLQERKENEMRSFSFTSPKGDTKVYTVPGHRYPSMPPGSTYDNNRQQYFDLERNYTFSRGPKLGLKIQDLEEGDGVKVLEVEAGSAAEKAGLKKDDVIVEVGTVKVKNTDDAREQLHENESKSSYPVVAKRNNQEMKFDIKIPKKLKTANL